MSPARLSLVDDAKKEVNLQNRSSSTPTKGVERR